jgi:preprotein translocase subunit SecY
VNDTLFKLFQIPETRKKITTTLWLLLAYRVGFQVPIPGMDAQYMRGAQDNLLFGLMSAFSGGAIGQTVIFGLGIMPYISASIIFSMLTKISPTLEAIQKEGAAGQKKINQWTRLAVIPIALLQALLVYTGVFLQRPDLIHPEMKDNKFLLGLIVISALIAGAVVVMWIGELITEYGVGNGASLIIMAGIVAQIPQALYALAGNEDFWQTVLYLLAIWSVTVFCVTFIHKGARRVPIQYARLTRGRRVYGGQRHYLPLKVNMAGVMPIIFASILFVIPAVILQWLNIGWLGEVFNDQTGFVYVAMTVSLIFGFTFFWNRLMFQPDEIANNLREHGSFVPGIRPGAKTAEFLSNILNRITIAGAAFLALVAVFPGFVTSGTSMPQTLSYFLGGTSVLIVVGVALELVDRLNAQLVMRNYEGFAKGSGASPGWTRKERV